MSKIPPCVFPVASSLISSREQKTTSQPRLLAILAKYLVSFVFFFLSIYSFLQSRDPASNRALQEMAPSNIFSIRLL